MRKGAISRGEVLLLGLATALAAWLRFHHLGAQPLWLDEATTADYAESGLMKSVFAEAPHPPLFYVIEHWVVRVLGSTDAALRLPSAVLGTLLAPAMWAVARRLFPQPRSTAAVAAVLGAVSPFLVYLGQEARSYSLLLLVTLLATLAFLRFAECEGPASAGSPAGRSKDRPLQASRQGAGGRGGVKPPLQEDRAGRRLIIYMALSALLLYTHYFGAWVLLAHEAAYWRHVRRRESEWVLARVNVALMFLPWAMWAGPQIGLASIAWVGSALLRTPYTLLRDLAGYGIAPQILAGESAEVILREEGWAVALVVGPLLWLLGRGAWRTLRARPGQAESTGGEALRGTLLAGLLVVPIAVLVAVSPWAKLLHERAVSFQAPFVLMLIAYGWATLGLRGRVVATLAAGGAIAFALTAYYGAPGEMFGYRFRYGKENWPSVAAYVEQQKPEAVIVRPGYLLLALKRYWRAPEGVPVVRLEEGRWELEAEAAGVQRLAVKGRVVLVVARGGAAERRLRARLEQTWQRAAEKYFPIQGGLRVVTYESSSGGGQPATDANEP